MLDQLNHPHNGLPLAPDRFDSLMPKLQDMQAAWLLGQALMQVGQQTIRQLGFEFVATLDHYNRLFRLSPDTPDAAKQAMLDAAFRGYARNTELIAYLHEHGLALLHQATMRQLQPAPPTPSALDEFMRGFTLGAWPAIKALGKPKSRTGKTDGKK